MQWGSGRAGAPRGEAAGPQGTGADGDSGGRSPRLRRGARSPAPFPFCLQSTSSNVNTELAAVLQTDEAPSQYLL